MYIVAFNTFKFFNGNPTFLNPDCITYDLANAWKFHHLETAIKYALINNAFVMRLEPTAQAI